MNIDQIAATVVESLYGADESRLVTRDDALAIAKLAAGMSNSEFVKVVTRPRACGQVNNGVVCQTPRAMGERLYPDCNPQPTDNKDIDQIIYALERARDANNRLANKLLDQRDYSAEMPAADAECIQQGIDLLMGLARHWQVAKREPVYPRQVEPYVFQYAEELFVAFDPTDGGSSVVGAWRRQQEAREALERLTASITPRCACCGTTENLHRDVGSGGPWRCNSADCMVF